MIPAIEERVMRVECEGTLDGAVSGWTGQTVFSFINGQRWKQASYSYRYFYRYRPQAKVFGNGNGFFLKIDGIDEKLPVKRLR